MWVGFLTRAKTTDLGEDTLHSDESMQLFHLPAISMLSIRLCCDSSSQSQGSITPQVKDWFKVEMSTQCPYRVLGNKPAPQDNLESGIALNLCRAAAVTRLRKTSLAVDNSDPDF